MIRNQQPIAEVHGVLHHHERRVQVDLTLTRSSRHVVKRMLVNGQKPRSRADLAESLPVTIFTPEGVDMVRHGPEGRRTFLTTLMTDVDLRTGDLVERFERTLRQRNAHLRAQHGETPTVSAREEYDAWTSDFVTVSHELLIARRRLVSQMIALVANFYRELAANTAIAFGLEPALDNGSIIHQRRGNRWYEINVEGREAHAGRSYGTHANAAHDLAAKPTT